MRSGCSTSSGPGPGPRGDGARDGGPRIVTNAPGGGLLARNAIAFARLLRRAGLPVGPDRITTALRAMDAVGVTRRDDLRAALAATLLGRREHRALFDAAFELWWRDPASFGPPDAPAGPDAGGEPLPARLAQALSALRSAADASADGRDGALQAAWSERERLGGRDFESMTVDELDAALRFVRDLPLPIDPIATRRRRPARRGEIDLRGTLRRAARDPGLLGVARRTRRTRPAPLVLLIDVSGSMQRYARVLLHFAHTLVQRRPRVAVFTFGTRLTDVTRALRHRDPDEALGIAARAVADWHGGTRIGPCLDRFNRDWARRVLTGRGALLLATDGLDRAEDARLGDAAARLSRFAKPLVWLNPLLRWEGFEPRAAGPRALMPHVDLHLPVHSLDSLARLSAELGAGPGRREGRRHGGVPSRH